MARGPSGFKPRRVGARELPISSVDESAFLDGSGSASPIPLPTFSTFFSLQAALHSYLNPTITLGNSRKLTASDHLPLPASYRARAVNRAFLSCWQKESTAGRDKRLWRSLHRLIFREFWVGGAFMLVNSVAVLMGTMYVKWIVVAAERRDLPSVTFYSFAILFNGLIGAFSLQAFIHSVFMCGSKSVSAAMSVIFSSVLYLRLHRLHPSRSFGELTNVQSKDAASLREFVVFAHNLWACPLLVVVSVSLLLHLLGWAGLVAAAVIPAVIPLETYIAGLTREARRATLKKSDERVALIGELLDGIRTVKLTGLAPVVFDKVSRLRDAELAVAWRGSIIEMANFVITRSQSLVIVLVTFAAYHLVATEPLTADRAFAAIAVIGVIGRPMRVIPKSITLLSDAQVSCGRIESLMMDALRFQPDLFDEVSAFEQEERQHARRQRETEENDSGGVGRVLVSVEGVTALRPPDAAVLRGVSLRPAVTCPGLTLVVGGNASGKTSLLLTVMGELDVRDAHGGGGVLREPQGAAFAYMGHDAWITNASAKDNILLAARGTAFREGVGVGDSGSEDKAAMYGADEGEIQKMYENAVKACALEVDFKDWKDGENTIIGEKGINISGGQKQRIALARALCSSGKLFFLDTPLAGLDERVAHHVFHEALLPLSKDRLVLMTTLNSGLLQHADRIIALEQGEVVFDGDYASYTKSGVADLLGLSSAAFAESRAAAQSRPAVETEATKKAPEEKKGKGKGGGGGGGDISESSSLFQAFAFYARACKLENLLSAVVLTVFAFALGALGDFLLAFQADGRMSMSAYLGYYTLVSVLVIGANFARYYMYSYAGYVASSDLHSQLLKSTIGATFDFFNRTPSGRLTSRFSSDFETIDDSIPSSIQNLMDALLGIITGVGVVCINSPIYILVAIPLTVLYVFVQSKYRDVSKELKKIEAGAKSPLFSNFREVVSGLETARGYQLQDLLIAKNEELIDFAITSRINWDLANRWLGIRLDFIGALIVSAAAFSLLLGAGGFDGVGGGGKAGLMLSYAMSACTSLSFAIRSSTALENYFTSCDRVGEYIKAPQEVVEFGHPPLHDSYNSFSGGAKALKGVTVLEGRNVVATYSPSLPPALKGVSFELKAGELVGFVGRTGSGKSTLSWVLARAMPIAEGSLLLQGTEVGTVPLKQYRDLVHIYPQDSFIFSGKLRLFLDPHGFHSDAKLNDLLDEFVKATASSSSEQRGGTSDHLLELDHAITAGGGNLSSGQKQVCTLVRAALSDAAVVVLDEVTSSMDMTSSTKAIEILQRELVRKDAAVLLVSHRPEDLVSCNAIWRMDAGTLSLEK